MRTSLYSIFCILIRLGAVIMAVSTIVAVPAAWMGAQATHAEGYVGVLLGLGGAMLAFAASLWIYPGVLARLAAGKASEQIFESPISAEELEQIAFAVVGVWFAIEAIAGLLAAVASIVVVSYEADAGEGVPLAAAMFRHETVRLVPLLVKLALGVVLAMRARGLVGWIRAFQDRGLPAPVAESADDAPGPRAG